MLMKLFLSLLIEVLINLSPWSSVRCVSELEWERQAELLRDTQTAG